MCAACPTPRLNLSSELRPSWNNIQDTFLTGSTQGTREDLWFRLPSDCVVRALVYSDTINIKTLVLLRPPPSSWPNEWPKQAGGSCVIKLHHQTRVNLLVFNKFHILNQQFSKMCTDTCCKVLYC